MNLVRALIGAVIGGLIGAAVWTAFTYFTNYEIAWIAIGIGLLVGLGAAIGAQGSTDAATGGIAAIIALGAILLGKFGVVHFQVNDFLSSSSISAQNITITDEQAQMHMADTLVEQYTQQGKTLKWPKDQSAETAEEPAHYPKELWADTQARWTAMPPEAQDAYKNSVRDYIQATLTAVLSSVKSSGFKESFSMYDFLWIGLAVAGAFKVGSGMESGGDD